jgi:osmotically-inducible protein OsmY
MVNKMVFFMVLFVSATFLVNHPGVSWAQPADNTEINKRDMSREKITADQQSQTKEDREITQKIRQAVIDDKSLSTYAHNVKIITVDGMVTLKGPVRSADEKRMIEEKAGQIAGMDKIKSEIEIAPQKEDN